MNQPPIIIDNGSNRCKAGFSRDYQPKADFPSMIGRPKFTNQMIQDQDIFIGNEAFAKKGVLKINYPIQQGNFINFDDMEKLWSYCFYNELKVEPQESPCMVVEAQMSPKLNREMMTKTMFETFQVRSFYIQIQAILSLYASGLSTGTVIESGDGVTQIVPVIDGYAIPYAINKSEITGSDLTEYCRDLMLEVGLNYQSSSEKEIIREIKEQCCYVALDYEQELNSFQRSSQNDISYQLPDGNQVNIQDQRLRIPELLFNPYFKGKNYPGIGELAIEAIMKSDSDIRREISEHIVLSGCTTKFKGFAERLKKDMSEYLKKYKTSFSSRLEHISFQNLSDITFKTNDLQERRYSPFIGGSILSSLSSFQDYWITKDEYEETGPSIVHRKCF